ncbi:hypothetical protein J2Z62_000086 [Mycoplasmoides fastidiosum]|uniref:ADP-ribosylating toxin CARDS C-terminal beta-trefoil domain-containing protein n=1 Tax=Mycoplasmoides fastidiosum TaxID=92758 RepID=A0ABU0LY92_9BACT|nr:hypothetical protein [Mycoplasmoides fastidiosum]MDQ0513648.1 hypothetical protein [Mycoplasmoides fastidiosum]UUD37932.1 hypothetical protein NPA10_00855 [Mycoplasmoides fastidiosum]
MSYRVSPQTVGGSDMALYYDPSKPLDVYNLFVAPVKNHPASWQPLVIKVGNDRTNLSFITTRASATHFVDLRMRWFLGGYYYKPLLSGWSSVGSPPPYTIIYDYRTCKIFWFTEKKEIFCLRNKRDFRYNSWDWVQWVKKPDLSEDNIEYKWFFSYKNLTVSSFLELNYRHIRSFKNGDWLKVTANGPRWGAWYTTHYENDYNSITRFDLKKGFDE